MVKNRDCRYLTEPQVLVLVLSVCFGDSLCLARTFTLVSTLHAVLNNQCFASSGSNFGRAILYCNGYCRPCNGEKSLHSLHCNCLNKGREGPVCGGDCPWQICKNTAGKSACVWGVVLHLGGGMGWCVGNLCVPSGLPHYVVHSLFKHILWLRGCVLFNVIAFSILFWIYVTSQKVNQYCNFWNCLVLQMF